MEQVQLPVASYGPGYSTTTRIKGEVMSAWENLLADPQTRDAIARTLGIEPDQLTPANAGIKVESECSNLAAHDAAYTVMIWLSSEVFLGVLKDELKRRVRQVWDEQLLPVIQDKLPSRDSMGKEHDLSD